MMIFRMTAVFLGLVLTIASPAFGDETSHQFQRIRDDYSTLMKSTRNKLYRENWLRVIDEFKWFSSNHADHRKGPAALYMAGRANEEMYRISLVPKDALQAAEIYDDVDSRFPQSSLADDALVLAARIHESLLNDSQEAVSRYVKVIRKYPDGDQFETARKALARLSPYALEAALKPAVQAEVSGPNTLQKIRSESHPLFSRVVLDLAGPGANYSYNTLPGDRSKNIAARFYIDLRNTTPGPEIKGWQDLQGPVLKQARTGRPDHDKTRVVLDLHAFGSFRIFTLGNPSRIVIDIAEKKIAWDDPSSSPQRPRPPPADHISRVLNGLPGKNETVINFKAGNELKLIVVDPGHGGKDPGAIGPNGVMEKDVVLAIAKKLAQQLRKEFQCKVVLTRDTDIFIPLQERTRIANRLNADLFISIHANASPNRKVYGIETYYLNFSKNEAAANVAARENGITLKEVSDLEMILFDLMANSKINESSLLADKVQKEVVRTLAGKYSNINDHGVRQGPFHVLVGATMPSILVETAYISNHKEESRLISGHYQDRVARGIVSGVKKFATTLDMVAKK